MKKKTTSVVDINCDEAISRFNDFMDNFLKEKARTELLKHIAECRHCMERFEFEQLLKSKVHLLSKESKNNAFVKRIESIIASIE